MYTCFLENALLTFPPNLFSMLALGVCCCGFDCVFLTLLIMMGSEDVWLTRSSMMKGVKGSEDNDCNL